VIQDDDHTPLRNLPMRSVPLDAERLRATDAVVVVTDHSQVDYALVAAEAPLVIDTRGAVRGIDGRARVVGLSGLSGADLARG
jgi:UDP-N-acetyl-D-glucosamine dehydrogenase